jgi:prepilin-type N-terminal cleavage/methylation domain-containing protein
MDLKLIRAYLTVHLAKKNSQIGFTLIELLVVVVMVGILSAIALPTYMGQIGRAREVEAKMTLSAIAKAQQLYYSEKTRFADDINKLDITIKGKYYNYTQPILIGNNVVKQQTILKNPNMSLKNYGIGVYQHNLGNYSTILCESSVPGANAEAPNTDTNNCISGVAID